MPAPDAPPKAPSKSDSKGQKDRRAPRGRVGAWRWLRGLLSRPLVLERRDQQWHLALGDRRRQPGVERAPTLAEVNEELHARLLAQDVDHAARVMRHLVFVHDELCRKGWRGVETLPAKVLGKAVVQLQMLAQDGPSPVLAHVAERLQKIHIGAQIREERRAQVHAEGAARVEVSEATAEEFAETERSWLGTMSPAAVPPRAPEKGGQ